jgi:hypothetical protein
MPQIDREHAVNWAGLSDVKRRCRGDSHEELKGGILQVYERAGAGVMPMRPLASELMKLLEEYREKGKAA